MEDSKCCGREREATQTEGGGGGVSDGGVVSKEAEWEGGWEERLGGTDAPQSLISDL